jgi:hypothetical protein
MKKTILLTMLSLTLLNACAYKPIIDTAGDHHLHLMKAKLKKFQTIYSIVKQWQKKIVPLLVIFFIGL